MGEAAEMLERIREGFGLERGLNARLSSEEVADGFVATLEPLASDDFVCVMDGGAMTTTYEGMEGLRHGWADFLGAFETLTIVPEEVRETTSGDCVVEFVHLIGRPKAASGEIEQDASAVWRVRDGRLTAVEFHTDRARALRSAGFEA